MYVTYIRDDCPKCTYFILFGLNRLTYKWVCTGCGFVKDFLSKGRGNA